MNSDTPTESSSATPDLNAFAAFFDSQRLALVEALVEQLKPQTRSYAEATDERIRREIEQYVQLYRLGIDQPEVLYQTARKHLVELVQQQINLKDLVQMVGIMRHLLVKLGLRAIAAGVTNADAGLERLIDLVSEFNVIITEGYQRQLLEDIQRQSSELRATQYRLEQAFYNSPLATMEWDSNGIVRFWNASAERIFGWSPEEAIGKNIIQMLVPDIAMEHVQAIVAALLNGQATNSRNVNITKDKRLITCQWYNAILRDEQGNVVGLLSQTEDVTNQLQGEEERAALQEQVIQAQAAALRELSTPLIPLADGVVAMPLIGSIDSARAQQVIEGLLIGVAENHASVTILDITGVPVVDTQVANALLQAAQAVKLLGAKVVLTGIRPEVAQTLVGLGVDMSGITTRSTLQSGIAYAFGRN